MTKKLQPKLRFRGFTDAWEQRKGAEAICIRKETESKPPKSVADVELENLVEGGGLQGDLSLRTASTSVFREHDILFGRLRPYLRKFWFANTSGVKSGEIWALHSSTLKPEFLYALVQSRRFLNLALQTAGTKMPRAEWETIAEANLAVPTICEEQEMVGNLFMKMDQLIAAEKRKLNLLKDKKTALLQRIFTQKIRFKSYDEPWVLQKLGDLYEANHERNNQGLPASKTLSVSTMSFNNQGNGAEESSLFNYKILRIGDIAFEGHQTKMHPYGRFVLNDVGVGIMSPRFTSLRPKKEQITSFWKYYINNEIIMNKILVFSTKAGTMMNELVVDDFGQQLVCVPSKEEQRVIGNLFIDLDSLVAAETRKVYLLELKKKALLQQMFV